MLPVPVPDPRRKFLPIPDPTRGYTRTRCNVSGYNVACSQSTLIGQLYIVTRSLYELSSLALLQHYAFGLYCLVC